MRIQRYHHAPRTVVWLAALIGLAFGFAAPAPLAAQSTRRPIPDAFYYDAW